MTIAPTLRAREMKMPETRRDVFGDCKKADADTRSGPHSWIQWKGTNVCMDVYCSCGQMSHVDAEFAYHIRCPHCGRLWAMCANVRMVEVKAEDIEGSCEPIEAQP
jgi:hypothetical protein